MTIIRLLCIWLLLASSDTARAITGGGGAPSNAIGKSIVTIIGSRGNVCTGALIAPNIVLTAGHCITPGTNYRVIDPTTTPPKLITASKVATHPSFNMRTMLAHRATADVAMLLLPSSVPNKTAATLGQPRVPIVNGSRLTIAGVGVTSSGSDAGVGTVRAASLAIRAGPGRCKFVWSIPSARISVRASAHAPAIPARLRSKTRTAAA